MSTFLSGRNWGDLATGTPTVNDLVARLKALRDRSDHHRSLLLSNVGDVRGCEGSGAYTTYSRRMELIAD